MTGKSFFFFKLLNLCFALCLTSSLMFLVETGTVVIHCLGDRKLKQLEEQVLLSLCLRNREHCVSRPGGWFSGEDREIGSRLPKLGKGVRLSGVPGLGFMIFGGGLTQWPLGGAWELYNLNA